jgi:hypothetical protein
VFKGAVTVAGETILLSAIGVVFGGLMVREVCCFVRWKRSVGCLDREELTRLVQNLRNK